MEVTSAQSGSLVLAVGIQLDVPIERNQGIYFCSAISTRYLVSFEKWVEIIYGEYLNHIFGCSKNSNEFGGGIQIREVTYPRPLTEIFEASLAAIEKLGWKTVSQNLETGEIKAKTGATLRSWGENVSIYVSQEETGSTISVYSEASSQLFDWGKSGKNETVFLEELKTIVSR